jgi:hypothetical protein
MFHPLEWEPIASCPEGTAVEGWVDRPDGGYRLPFPIAWRPRRAADGIAICSPAMVPSGCDPRRRWQNVEYESPIDLVVAPSHWRRWPERVSAVFVTRELPRRQAGVRA